MAEALKYAEGCWNEKGSRYFCIAIWVRSTNNRLQLHLGRSVARGKMNAHKAIEIME